jgi:hypothetical protein
VADHDQRGRPKRAQPCPNRRIEARDDRLLRLPPGVATPADVLPRARAEALIPRARTVRLRDARIDGERSAAHGNQLLSGLLRLRLVARHREQLSRQRAGQLTGRGPPGIAKPPSLGREVRLPFGHRVTDEHDLGHDSMVTRRPARARAPERLRARTRRALSTSSVRRD